MNEPSAESDAEDELDWNAPCPCQACREWRATRQGDER